MVKLDTLQESINALQKTQKTTNNNVEGLGSRELVPIGLMLVLLVLSIITLVLGRKKPPTVVSLAGMQKANGEMKP
jgi:hypothetical protein